MMDREQQVRLNFLEEAEQYYDRMESVLVGIADRGAEVEQLDEILRFAHSVKGGAGMMGFMPLSQIAHRLEDFLKILRARSQSQSLDQALATLLLQSVDQLRQVGELCRQGQEIDDIWLARQTEPIFAQLQSRLGDLQPEDEVALLAAEEDVDISLILFEHGVETVLEQLESKLSTAPSVSQTAEALLTAADELVNFGRMRDLEAFVQLCQSVSQQVKAGSAQQIVMLADQALKLWRQSQALVSLDRLDQLPNHCPLSECCLDIAETSAVPAQFEVDLDLSEFDSLTDLDLGDLESAIANIDLLQLPNGFTELTPVPEPLRTDNFDGLEDFADLADLPDLAELQTALEQLEIEPIPEPITVAHPPLGAVNAPLELVVAPQANVPALNSSIESSGKTVRVPLEQLQRFNTLFSGVVLERNSINLRMSQTQEFVNRLRERMYRLETLNTQLQKWYDRASLDGIVANSPASIQASRLEYPSVQSGGGKAAEQFDTLEMDRYTDLHLLSQVQMETIVQLQEVMGDVDFSLRELGQAVEDLNQSTRAVQDTATCLQMRPFSDLVGRLPRVVRDWAITFGKSVQLKLEGEGTLLDREAMESLSDPLMHLLRNAFDHGIETPTQRLLAGKPEQGTIQLRAINQGNQTLITLSDDGQGIDVKKIRARALKMGLPDSLLKNASEQALLELIFEPGFSTAEQVSELSGRGVGMDVVRTNLQKLRSEIQIDTQVGRGTTFTISLPFNPSILSVLLLERADFVFSIAADSIRAVVHPTQAELLSREGQEYLHWQGQVVPLLPLERSLTYRRASKPFTLVGTPAIKSPTILLIGQGSSFRGVYVDRVWGEQEVAIRPIFSPLPLLPGFFSSSLLGDGRVVPLIDLVQLADWICAQPHSQPTSQSVASSAELPAQTGQVFSVQKSSYEDAPILVVDDSINVRRYLAMVLERAGYRVEQASDGQEAVEQLTNGLKVQAVICDIEMPRLDGYGVLTALRTKAAFKTLPIAMLTSRSGDKHRKLAMNLGATAYLSKPCTDQELLNSLKMMLEQTQMILA